MMINYHTLNFSDAADIRIANATSMSDDKSIPLSFQEVDLTSNIEDSMEGSSAGSRERTIESNTPQTDVDLWNSGTMETLLGENVGAAHSTSSSTAPPRTVLSRTVASSQSCTDYAAPLYTALPNTAMPTTVALHRAPSRQLWTSFGDDQSMESEYDVDFREKLHSTHSSSSAADIASSQTSPSTTAPVCSAPVRSAPYRTTPVRTAPVRTAPVRSVPSRSDQPAAGNNVWTVFGDHRSLESEDEDIFGRQSNSPPSRSSVKTVPTSKPTTIAHSFRRTKSLKEKLLEKKIDWQREKFEKQYKLQLEMMEKSEKSKQKRHDEKKELLSKYLKENQ